MELWCSQADKSRVKDYIHRLDNFDGPAVGEIAVGYEMFEEAFEIYKKFGLKTQAIKVLLEHQEDLERALEYALKVRHAVQHTTLMTVCNQTTDFSCDAADLSDLLLLTLHGLGN